MQVIQKFLKNPLRNFNYIITSETSSDTIFFDPFDINQTLPLIGDRKPKYLINTHHHPDHVRHNEEFLALKGTEHIKHKDGEILELSSNEKIKAVYTPGHVHDHYCFFLYESEELVGIITGDTIFNAGVGNCKNGGDPDQLYETIKNIFEPINGEIPIYPSHDYLLSNLKFAQTLEPENKTLMSWIDKRSQMDLDNEFLNTTMAEEKTINPFFKVFQGVFNEKFPEKSEREIFKSIRSQRDKW